MTEREIRVEGWRFVVVFAFLFIIGILATIGAIAVVVLVYDVWPRIAGTGEHEVKMIWRQ
jgi:hypothetical protein